MTLEFNFLADDRLKEKTCRSTAVTKLTPESFRGHRLPLLNLPPDILEALHQGKIAYTKARALSKVADEEARKKLLDEAIDSSLSLSRIRERVAQIVDKEEKEDLKSRFDSDLAPVQ